jgi:hypothetical protein
LRVARLTKTASSSVIGEETFKDYCPFFLQICLKMGKRGSPKTYNLTVLYLRLLAH